MAEAEHDSQLILQAGKQHNRQLAPRHGLCVSYEGQFWGKQKNTHLFLLHTATRAETRGMTLPRFDVQSKDYNPANPTYNDHDLCTKNIVVQDHHNQKYKCVHYPIICDDRDESTLDSCDPQHGCLTTPVPCNDYKDCTSDSCKSRKFNVSCEFEDTKSCYDQDACTLDGCEPHGACFNKPKRRTRTSATTAATITSVHWMAVSRRRLLLQRYQRQVR
eukprot:g1562.t1